VADDAPNGFAPPYTSFRTLMNLVERMEAEGGVPSRIDRSYLSNLPGGTQTMLLGGMKSLGLIDPEARPTDLLIGLVQRPAARAELIGELVEDKYAPALKLGKNATQSQLEEVFRNYGVTGSTLRKAVAFFLAAAKYAEIEVSPHFRTPRQQTNGTRQPRRKASRRQDTGFPGSPAPDAFQPSPPPASGQHPFIQGLLQTLPPVGNEWPQVEREKWTQAALAAFNLIYELPPSRKGGDDD
jgi:hypothetical protein